MEVLEQLNSNQIATLKTWCRKQPLEKTTYSSYALGRIEKWYGLGSNLQSIPFKRAQIFPCPNVPKSIAAIGEKHIPGWNSCLVCGGLTNIDWHRDHGHFTDPAVMINLGDALYEEMPDPKMPNRKNSYNIKDGQILLLNTKLLHKATQVSDVRFNITFRIIRTEFLQPTLF